MFLKPGTLNALMKKAYKSGLAVGFTDLIVTGYLDVIYNDAIDVGVGILPEQFFVQKNKNHVEKCAIVYYAKQQKALCTIGRYRMRKQ